MGRFNQPPSSADGGQLSFHSKYSFLVISSLASCRLRNILKTLLNAFKARISFRPLLSTKYEGQGIYTFTPDISSRFTSRLYT